MDYKEYNICIEVFQNKPKWFSRQDNVQQKLECLEKFRAKGTPSQIDALIPLLKDKHESIRLTAADVIISQFHKLKSQSQLYSSLKYLPIEESDIDYFKINFKTDIAVKLLAIATFDHSGYVREKAINALAALRHPQAIRYILLRLGDWVKAVREAAYNAINAYFENTYTEVFINELKTVELLQRVERVDLQPAYNSIIHFITSNELTNEFYQNLHVSDTARLLYVRSYFRVKPFEKSYTQLLISDKDFIVRMEILRHLDPLALKADEYAIINKLLQDSSSQVRLSALYFVKNNFAAFEDIIYQLISDESASVRDLARFLLKGKGYVFRAIYKERISQKQRLVGSLLGLAETGTEEDLEIFEALITDENAHIKRACLNGIHRFNPSSARRHSLSLLTYPRNKVRNQCIEILAKTWDREVLETVRKLYNHGDSEQKRTALKLYNTVGGWDVIGELILAVADTDLQIQDLAWSFLKRWRDNALHLFTSPPKEIIEGAIDCYDKIDITKIGMTTYREVLWSDIKYYLRR